LKLQPVQFNPKLLTWQFPNLKLQPKSKSYCHLFLLRGGWQILVDDLASTGFSFKAGDARVFAFARGGS
jgi:hypothetical protein